MGGTQSRAKHDPTDVFKRTKFSRKQRKLLSTYNLCASPMGVATFLHSTAVHTQEKQSILTAIDPLDLGSVYDNYMSSISFEHMDLDIALMDVSITVTFLLNHEGHADTYVSSFAAEYYNDNKDTKFYKSPVDVYLISQGIIKLMCKVQSGEKSPRDASTWVNSMADFSSSPNDIKPVLRKIYERIQRHSGMESIASLSPRGQR